MNAAATAGHATREIPGIGTLTFEQTQRTRSYWLLPEGRERRVRLPSVTTIIGATWPKPALIEWYARHGRDAHRMRDESSSRGQRVHSFVERYLRDGDLADFSEYPEDDHPYLTGAAKFLWEFQPEPVEDGVERLVCHPELAYAGRLDLLARCEGIHTLLDFKTSPKGNVYTEAHVQATAYAIADERCGGEAAQMRLLVAINGEGGYRADIGKDATEAWQTGLEFYRAMSKLRKDLGVSS